MTGPEQHSTDDAAERAWVDSLLGALDASDGSEAGDRIGWSVAADPDLLKTMWISREFLAALRNSGLMETFLRLPRQDQAFFLGVIGMTEDPNVRRKRTSILISALAGSPLAGAHKGSRLGVKS